MPVLVVKQAKLGILLRNSGEQVGYGKCDFVILSLFGDNAQLGGKNISGNKPVGVVIGVVAGIVTLLPVVVWRVIVVEIPAGIVPFCLIDE